MGPKCNHQQIINNLNAKVQEYAKRFQLLEARIEKFEASEAVLKTVTNNLRDELDSLDQFGRRSNLLIRNVEINDTDSKDADQKKIETVVNDLISKKLKLPACAAQVDKLHRVGKKKERDNKKFQNIVVRFTSHRARYEVYRKKTDLTNGLKFNPQLTKRRGKLLSDSIQIAEKVDEIDFAYANIHGDICVRFKEAVNGTESFSFTSKEGLLRKLKDLDIVDLDEEGNLAE